MRMLAHARIDAGQGRHTFIRVGQGEDGWFRIDCLRPDNMIIRPPLPIFRTKDAALDAIAEHWHADHHRLEWLID